MSSKYEGFLWKQLSSLAAGTSKSLPIEKEKHLNQTLHVLTVFWVLYHDVCMLIFRGGLMRAKTIYVSWPNIRVHTVDGSEILDNHLQWLFLVPIIGGRYHIITQLAVYTTYIPLIYIANWVIIWYLQPIKGTRKLH